MNCSLTIKKIIHKYIAFSTLYYEDVIKYDMMNVDVWCLVFPVWYDILNNFESFSRGKMY